MSKTSSVSVMIFINTLSMCIVSFFLALPSKLSHYIMVLEQDLL